MVGQNVLAPAVARTLKLYTTHPYMKLCITLSDTPGAFFPNSISRHPKGCQYRTISLRKALGEIFPTLAFSTPTLFQL